MSAPGRGREASTPRAEPGSAAPVLGVPALRADPDSSLAPGSEEVAVEEPLEIRIVGDVFAVTMRTPGHDRELVAGLLLSEGLIGSRADLGGIVHCARPGDEGARNAVEVTPAPGAVFDANVLERTRRGTLGTSACGVCGRVLIDDLVSRLVPPGVARFERAFIAGLTAELRARQPCFERTGGLHAAGVAEPGTGLVVVREDVGRHNAVDKVVGRLLLDDRLPASGSALVVSGRTSFEIVQKALAAGMAAVVGVSAPSSLAVSTASRFDLLLCGFARDGRFNVYAGAGRLGP